MALLEAAPGAYIDHVLAEIRAVLAREQLDIWVGLDTEGPGSNPVRAWPPMARAGVDIPNERVDGVLDKLEIEIWAFRERLYHSRDMVWYDCPCSRSARRCSRIDARARSGWTACGRAGGI